MGKRVFNKKCIVHLFLLFLDILLVLFCAFKNKVHYVDFFSSSVLVGNTWDMLLGRNCVNVIITFFFWFYIMAIDKFYFKKNFSFKRGFVLLLLLIFINFSLFYIFTRRVY